MYQNNLGKSDWKGGASCKSVTYGRENILGHKFAIWA